jgi:nucleoside-diphosphate-sugar epimerase
MHDSHRKILVTGAFGQIGTELVASLQSQIGKENVVAVDINIPNIFDGISEKFNILETEKLENCIQKYQITEIYHLVSLLSARGEQNPNLAWKLNIDSLKSILDLAVKYQIKVFWPSSIAAFGPTTPRINTPQNTILEPTTMYGVTKVTGELLCRYYHEKYDLDVRTVRYPGLVSWKQEPGGGTTDYAVAIFYDAIQKGEYTCFVSDDTILPMMYMDDAIRGTLELMDVSREKLPAYKPYNLGGLSFRADELAAEINKLHPVRVTYIPDDRQKIADSWPQSIDDSAARKDWGWQNKFDLADMVKEMYTRLSEKLNKKIPT